MKGRVHLLGCSPTQDDNGWWRQTVHDGPANSSHGALRRSVAECPMLQQSTESLRDHNPTPLTPSCCLLGVERMSRLITPAVATAFGLRQQATTGGTWAEWRNSRRSVAKEKCSATQSTTTSIAMAPKKCRPATQSTFATACCSRLRFSENYPKNFNRGRFAAESRMLLQ